MSSPSMQRIWSALGSLNKATNTAGQEQVDSLAETLETILEFLAEDRQTDPALCAERDGAITLAREAISKARGEP